ncbi:L-threonylcarbamoyladenylate synthase [Parvimonas micra]|uniref:L-threonylcarbamoyladenylate synthase n=1 Tax=Parvimonas micra TaxID=33033 RepID=UPI002B45BACD|nr:L-threonylcarbamoyladenylate synthase [Parvimonas micra]MEB3028735.1 L-threonylcarbamoyladenylate synthase [Parvimonas micra]
MTEILKPTRENIERSAKLILNDEIVAIPTETVYGLGANGLSDIAVSKIFKAKNRPQDNPLILHISDYDMMENLVYELSDEIKEFLNHFWPGPLTVVMKKKDIIPEAVSCGLDTVAIRMPNNEIARSFIKQCGVPIAAPSANISGKPSPTTAEDVFTDMNGKISVILDGGLCNIGIESTVLDLTKKPYTILRPGFYTKEDFLKYEDEILIDDAIVTENIIPKSPGQKYKHYAPKAKVLVISAKDRKKSSIEIEKIIKENKDLKIGIFKFDETFLNVESENILSLGSVFDLREMSKILFRGLREFDENNVDLIVVEGCDEKGLGFSIMNRLKKSASGNIKYID